MKKGGKKIALTKGQFAVVDDEDYEWLSKYRWAAHNGRNGASFYAICNQGDRPILMHRMIMQAPLGIRVDHKDRDGLNNRRANLRLASHADNIRNASKSRRNTSGYKGVYWHRAARKWVAQIQVDGSHIYLGLFRAVEEAARAYDRAARQHFGEFACTNF